MLASFGVLLMAACVKLACCNCQKVKGVYVCASIPQSFPENLKSILFFATRVGELNSTVFSSETLSSVTSLILSSTATTAILPGALSKFQQLEVLELSQNQLEKVSPVWFSHPEVLKNITLSHNIIENIDLTDLSDFSGLVSLNLSGNLIHTVSLGSFSDLRNLQVLDLSDNALMYVNPEAFQTISDATIHLEGNPWDCSCGKPDFEYFVEFLQGLKSASRLENEMAVTCNTPAPLQNIPVLRVSCPSPRPTITGGSTTDLSVTAFRATTLTLFPHTPSVNTPGSVGKPVIGLAALICLIVVLCILVCVVCVLSFLYHRKLKKKRVVPHATAQSVGSNLHQTGFAQKKEPMNSEAITRNLVTGRAKSAGPVMCRSEVLTKETTTLSKGEREKGLHLSSETNRSEDGGTHVAAVTGNGTEHTEEHNPDLLYGAEKHTDLVENTEEDFPYLTIGIKPPTECCKDHGHDNEGKTHLTEKIQRKFVRVKTWPPTAIQWARQQAKQDEVIDVSFFQKLQAELRLGKQEISNVNFQPVSPSGGSPTNDPESLSVDVPLGGTDKARVAEESPGLGLDDETWKGDGTLPDSDHLHYNVIDAEPDQSILNTPRLETTEGMTHSSIERIEMGITTQKIEEPDQSIRNTLRLETAEGMADGSNERSEMGITTQKIEEPDQSTLNMFETTQGMADGSNERLEMGITTQKIEEPDQSILNMFETTRGMADGSNERLEMCITTQNIEEPDQSILNMFETTRGMADSSNGMRLEMDITTQKTEEESSSKVKREKSRTGTSQSRRRPRESSRTKREGSQADKITTGASVLPKPGSPGDESLLRDNEYVFIDLLHEVVENRGRWTRERWRQSHLNRKKFQLK